MVFAEATSVLPLLASDAYHRGHWKNRDEARASPSCSTDEARARHGRRGGHGVPPALAGEPTADLLIRHATIVDVAKGRTTPDQAVAVRGGDIVAVGPDADDRSPLFGKPDGRCDRQVRHAGPVGHARPFRRRTGADRRE